MKSEMELLRFDERQRLAWLLANRGTVIAVGLTWIGMIVWELARDRVPLFMIAMVPVFALLRVGLFFYYCSTSAESEGPSSAGKLGGHLKTAATVLLIVAIFLPLYGLGDPSNASGSGAKTGLRYAWELVAYDWILVFPLAFAFFWPLPLRFLARESASRRVAILAQWAEPLLAAASVLTILWIPHVLFEFRQTLWFLFVLESARPQVGCYVVVAANGLYIVGWMMTLLRPSDLQSSNAA